MHESQAVQAETSKRSCNPILTLGGRVSQRTTLTVLAVAGVGSGLILGWDSPVAAGVSGILLAVLPCAAMCALGLCARGLGRNDAGSSSTKSTDPRRPPISSFRRTASAAACS